MAKSKIIIAMLALFLAISVYFNMKQEEPLYSLNIGIPVEVNGAFGGFNIVNVIDTNHDRETYLNLMNILENYFVTEADKEMTSPIPDLIIMRSIPDMGIFSGEYGIFFENESAYVMKGTEYRGQQIYQFDEETTKKIEEFTGVRLEK